MKNLSLRVCSLALLGLLSGVFAEAQFLPEPLALVTTPSSPSPGETYTVTAATPTLDKNSAFFEWFLDGRRSDLSGPGKNSLTLSAGSVGSATRVSVRVLHPTQTLTASLTVRPANLSLVWFAETYTPRWYKGKALPTQNSVVNVIAIPEIFIDGIRVRSDALIYRWSLDDQTDVLSGAGEETFRIQTSNLPQASHRVRLMVESATRSVQKEGEIFIVPVIPRVLVYASSPLGRINPRSALSFLATEKRGLLDFEAEPFFFSVSSKRELSYRWRLGTSEVEGTADNPSVLTLNTERQPAGAIPVSVAVDDTNPLISAATKLFTLFLQ